MSVVQGGVAAPVWVMGNEAAGQQPLLAGSNQIGAVALQGDAVPSQLYSVDVTLGTTDAVSSFAIPAGARGFQVLAASARLRFAVNADPPNAFTTTSAASNTGTGYLGAYNTVSQGVDVTRLFDKNSTNTTLRVNSETASATFTLEFF